MCFPLEFAPWLKENTHVLNLVAKMPRRFLLVYGLLVFFGGRTGDGGSRFFGGDGVKSIALLDMSKGKGRPALPGGATKQLRILRGNPSGKKIGGEPEPEVVAEIPEPPITLTDYARKFWNEYCATMIRLGMLTQLDTMMLARYCDAISKWVFMNSVIQKAQEDQNFVVFSNNLYELNKQNTVLLAMEKELGLTPASRTRIRIDITAAPRGVPEDRSGLGAFMASDPVKPIATAV